MNETKDKNILKMDYPASWWAARWREALPAGNGCIGAAVNVEDRGKVPRSGLTYWPISVR